MDLTEIKQRGDCMCLALETEIQCRIHFQLEHWVLTSRKILMKEKSTTSLGFFVSFFKTGTSVI